MSSVLAAPIDPLRPLSGSAYRDELVEVRPGRRGPTTPSAQPAARLITRTDDFDVLREAGRLVVEHQLRLVDLDEDLTGQLRRQLFDAGWLRGNDLFERVLTGLVVTTDADPARAWEAFYRNTLNRLDEQLAGSAGPATRDADAPAGCDPTAGGAVIAEHARLCSRAVALTAGRSAVELGCCFGFLSLLLARGGVRTTAVDIAPGTIRLLRTVAALLGVPVRAVVADAARVPRPDSCVDTVLVIHLLEHVSPEHGHEVLREALRLARRRVVVAVPYEDRPADVYGHVRVVTRGDLVAWGRASRQAFDVSDDHGGWLVIDRGASGTG